MECIGAGRTERLTFLVSPPHQYGVAELADLLIYVGFQCQVIQLTRQSSRDMRTTLKEASVAIVFAAAEPKLLPEEWPQSVRIVATFNHPKELRGEFRHFDILHLDETPLLALRKQPGPYAWLKDHFHLEESPNETLIVTTLSHRFEPFIRYDTGIHARVDGHNLFLVDGLI